MSEAQEKDVKEIAKEEFKVAVENLKKEGLDIAEEALVKVVKEVDATVKRIAVRTPNKVDDLYTLVSDDLVETAVDAIDKIDGEKDFE